MNETLRVLRERGYVAQTTHDAELEALFDAGPVRFYLGIDPTADSLHAGHFLAIMAAAQLQRLGHKPIILVGGGTAMIGDPSGRTDMRKMLTREDLDRNVAGIKSQLARLIRFDEDNAILVNNADWLCNLNYLDFLRDIGVHFSVNRMLTAECVKTRMEKGLTFLEFNYMLMQGYDFYELYRRYGCRLQIGGDDQWSNILAGTDLIRRKEGAEAYGLTLQLLTTAQGKKMGKTAAGALWLDENKTSPYEFYQYWRNLDDADVGKCLALLTFLPMDEVRELSALQDAQINIAKKRLAYEVTALVHGEEAARSAQAAAESLFGGGGEADVPSCTLPKAELTDSLRVIDLLVRANLAKSLGEGRRLISGGGVFVNGNRVEEPDAAVRPEDFEDGAMMLKKGKKAFCRIVLQ